MTQTVDRPPKWGNVSRSIARFLLWGLVLLVWREPWSLEYPLDNEAAGFLCRTSFPSEKGFFAEPFGNYPPGLFLIQRPLAWLFGPYPLWPLRLAYLALILVAAEGIRRWGIRAGGEGAGFLAAWFWIFGSSAPRAITAPYPDVPMVFWQFWSGFAFAKSLGAPNARNHLFWGGFFAGLSSFFKFHGLLILLPQGLALLCEKGTLRQKATRLAWLAFGVASFWGAACAVLALSGGLGVFWEWSVLCGFRYVAEETTDMWAKFWHGARVMGFCWLAFWPGLLWGAARALRKGRVLDLFLVSWVGVVVLAAGATPYAFTPKYFYPALAPLCVLAALCYADLARRVVWLPVFAFCVAALMPVAYNVIYLYRGPVSDAAGRNIKEAGRYIRETTAEEDVIFVLDLDLRSVLFFAQREQWAVFPSWWVAQRSMPEHPLYDPERYRPMRISDMERMLRDNPPKILVDHAAVDECDWMKRWMPAFMKEYAPDRDFGHVRLYRRLE